MSNQQQLVKRTGRETLVFVGSPIFYGTTDLERRAHRVTIYQTQGGNLVLAIHYQTTWHRERDRHTAIVCREPDQVLAALAEYDPENDVTGFPQGEQFRGREAEVKREVVETFDDLISRLCDQLGWYEYVD